jgi:hypothetical protein
MTSGRFWLLATATIVPMALVSAAGCSGDALQPCNSTNCVPIEGRYALSFEQGTFTDSGDCEAFPLTLPKELSVTRSVAQLTGRLDQGQTLTGTVYSNGEFNLLGSGLTRPDAGVGDTLNAGFIGNYIPPRGGGTGADGGTTAGDGGVAQLTGTFNGTRSGSSGGTSQRCQVTRSFTATRQP